MSKLNLGSKLLLVSLLMLLTSCATAPPQLKEPVFIKCQIPEVPKSELYPLDTTKSYPEKLKAILNNYFLIEKENQLLREALEVCK